ncbi:Rpn family recombination-promoting nuclease/putative transposase [Vibrio parahaemolyticus]|uniref:Rpn family recombination-promoting nuclease/putative transposase n=1 Tax=Vibrio parahaemolyticus TaxID=670 RepID=UPI0023E45AB6|nr:Rpn family recombination-promoting nuclease/putative transposase [Vibrio parahaemolyticus]
MLLHCSFVYQRPRSLFLPQKNRNQPGERPYVSDVLYSMRTTLGTSYVYAFVEHQSRSDQVMAFHMLRYAIAAMRQHINSRHYQLLLVIPILFYHSITFYSLNWFYLFQEPHIAQSL